MSEISYALFSSPANERIISGLAAAGNRVHLIPPLVTERLELDEPVKQAIRWLTETDWLIFTDVFTVDYFIEFLYENEIDIFDLDSVRICAFGEAVSDRLRFSEVHSDIIATSVDCNSIFDSLSRYLGESITKSTFSFLKRQTVKIEVSERMKSLGISVEEISVYRELEDETKQSSKIRALIVGGAIDEIIFSAPADLVGLSVIFKDQNLREGLLGVDLSVVDKMMYRMLSEYGLKGQFFSKPSA